MTSHPHFLYGRHNHISHTLHKFACDFTALSSLQAAHLLEAPKGTPDDVLSICSTCFKLNSLQLRALLENYIPGPGEPRIQPELIARVVGVAQSTADELTRSDGRDVRYLLIEKFL